MAEASVQIVQLRLDRFLLLRLRLSPCVRDLSAVAAMRRLRRRKRRADLSIRLFAYDHFYDSRSDRSDLEMDELTEASLAWMFNILSTRSWMYKNATPAKCDFMQ